jgi:hypothetical protein
MEEELFKRLTVTATRPSKYRKAIFSCGASGVGKTSGKESFLKEAGIKTSFVYISLDKIRLITGNNETAQTMLDYIIKRTISRGYSFFWDATCRNKNAIIDAMKKSKEKGYKIIFAMTYAKLDTALKRVKERITQQTPEVIVRDIYQHMQKNAEVYMDLSEIDEMYLYNNDKTSTLIFYKDKKKIECIHPEMNFYFDVSKYC